jgi:Flp pilus assembly protein TadG
MVSSFRRDQKGAVAIIFALALIPMMLFMGVAIDYTRAANVRTEMQAAIDATALAVAREPSSISDDEFAQQARAMFDGDFSASDAVAIDSFSASRATDTGVVTVSASGHLKTSLLGAVDVSSIQFGATTTAQSGSKNLEVVMALDNTGSMADNNKIGELIQAANDLVDDLSTNITGAGQLKIGMVPFTTDVRLDSSDPTYTGASWIDFSNAQTQSCSWTYNRRTGWTQTCSNVLSWNGCITDRTQPYNTSDAAVTGSTTEYPAVKTCPDSNLALVQPLTTDFASLKTEINTMTAGGNTNVTIGAIWGLALLSQQAPFTQGAAYSDTETEKYLIILTDGANTADRYSSCNTYSGINMTCVGTMNDRTLAACSAAKSAGLTVYTIGVMLDTSTVDGASADAMLRSCATDSSYYVPVSNAEALVPTFIGIAKSIENLRLTN